MDGVSAGSPLPAIEISPRLVGRQELKSKPVKTYGQVQTRFDRAEIELFMHDRPQLQYIVANDLMQNVKIEPYSVAPQYYAIIFPQGSALREPVDQALLQVIESDSWKLVLDKYLGEQ